MNPLEPEEPSALVQAVVCIAFGLFYAALLLAYCTKTPTPRIRP